MISWLRRRRQSSDETTTTTTTAPAAAPAPPAAAPAPLAPAFVAEIPHDKIAARAAEIWDRKGRPHGQDVQNWMEAEAELRAEFAAPPESLPRKSR